jgi:hypothetical protein
MARKRWTSRSATSGADLLIWWATLSDQERRFVRSGAWSVAADHQFVEFLAVSDCPLMAEPFDPNRAHLLTDSGRFLTFLQEQAAV